MDCIFCKIIDKQIDAPRIYEDDNFIVIPDKFPKFAVHILIIPKKHVESIGFAEEGDSIMLGKMLLLAKDVAAKQNLADFQLIFNNGKYTQVPHLHLHLVSGQLVEKV